MSENLPSPLSVLANELALAGPAAKLKGLAETVEHAMRAAGAPDASVERHAHVLRRGISEIEAGRAAIVEAARRLEAAPGLGTTIDLLAAQIVEATCARLACLGAA